MTTIDVGDGDGTTNRQPVAWVIRVTGLGVHAAGEGWVHLDFPYGDLTAKEYVDQRGWGCLAYTDPASATQFDFNKAREFLLAVSEWYRRNAKWGENGSYRLVPVHDHGIDKFR